MITSPTNVKKFALATATAIRPAAGFERVSKEFLDKVEAHTRAFIVEQVRQHPSKGVTIK